MIPTYSLHVLSSRRVESRLFCTQTRVTSQLCSLLQPLASGDRPLRDVLIWVAWSLLTGNGFTPERGPILTSHPAP